MARGTLRVYLGAAPGVGKTYAMLNEGWRRKERGTDVVVAYLETHGRPNTEEQCRDLEVVPRMAVEHRGARFEEMDLDAVLARAPAVALVDELAHTNIPGLRHTKRWEDVEELLAAGIDVISTVNIQHLESLNDVVQRITGVVQRETVPDAVVRAADQIELVDMSPEALRRRMAHGNIYKPEKVDAALGNYFRIGNLAALRELALLWVADRVEESIDAYLDAHGIDDVWETRERVVVAVTGSPTAERLVRRAARIAQRSRAELVGVHVRPADGLRSESSGGDLRPAPRLLAELGGRYAEIVGDDVPEALVRFARAEHATQLVMGASGRSRWAELTSGSVINRVIRNSGDIDVHVISQDSEPRSAAVPRPPHRRRSPVPRRRQHAGWLLAVVGLPVMTVALAPHREGLGLPLALGLYLLAVLGVTVVGGVFPALASAVAAFGIINWFFTPPVHTFTVSDPENFGALLVFLGAAGVVSVVVDQAARRATEAARAKAEAEALASVAGAFAIENDPLQTLVDGLRSTFGLDAAAVLRAKGSAPDDVEILAACGLAGAEVPLARDADLTIPLDPDSWLVIDGPVDAADRGLLTAFASQLAAALARRALQVEAEGAEALAQGNELRTALLAAVSHDLRTPLSSIKASAGSLLEPGLDLDPASVRALLETIDEEADRLNALVGNLLDMSRLQTGSVHLVRRPVGMDEIVAAVLSGIPDAPVTVNVPEDLPAVDADPVLLERVVANVVGNAVAWAPPDRPPRITAGVVGGRVRLHVVDQGPGIADSDKDSAFLPFQRLGDTPDRRTGAGVGLGLAVARGFTELMGGELELEDTPGGGLTVVATFPLAGDPVTDVVGAPQ